MSAPAGRANPRDPREPGARGTRRSSPEQVPRSGESDGDMVPRSGDSDGDMVPRSGESDGGMVPRSGDSDGDMVPPSLREEMTAQHDLIRAEHDQAEHDQVVAELEQVKAQLAAAEAKQAAAEAKQAEYLGDAQRVQAEFKNFRQRNTERQRLELTRESSRFVEKLLPILDAAQAALSQESSGLTSVEGQANQAALGQAEQTDQDRSGAYQLAQLLVQTLEKIGLERIPVTLGAELDPTEHESVSLAQPPLDATAEPSDCLDGVQVVTAELRAGYRFNGQVLRPAQVQAGIQAT